MTLATADKIKIAHLLRRAGFGARPDEWPLYEKLGVAGTTDFLLYPEKTPDVMQVLLGQIQEDFVDFDEIESVRSWWLLRMMRTRRPLEEKMTLFWHQHFATANYKVNNPRLMWQQNELFRKHALGNFRSLLQAVVHDGAMLIWLDGAENRAGKPNENFAREVMELFAIGIGNGYSEKDIQEAARALTGWRFADNYRVVFDPFLHDDGPKTVFGQTANFHGDDVIDLIAAHPATGNFLAAKLFRYFVHDNPSKADIEPVAQAYYSSGYDVRAMLETLLKAPAFYSAQAMYSRIKSPVEFAVMAMRSLNAPMTAVKELQKNLNNMGQELFNPPSVKGWDGGASWINSRTLMARMSFTGELTGAMSRRGTLQKIALGDLAEAMTDADSKATNATPKAMPQPFPSLSASGSSGNSMDATGAMMNNAMMGTMNAPAAVANMPKLNAQQLASLTPTKVVNSLWEALLPGQEARPATQAALLDYVSSGKDNVVEKLPGLVNLIMAAPEYQLI
jgi:hypothetical protein